MVSLPNTIWACTAGAMNSAPTATATAFLFIFPPPGRCSSMRNRDLEHGTATEEATSDASRRQVHARFFMARTRWRSAAICGNATLPSVLIELEAARLERAADLSRDIGLWQRNAARGGHFRDDRHVVLRPGHGLRAPLRQRLVGGARHGERVSHQVNIQPVAPGEREAFMVRDQAGPHDEVIHSLGDLRRSYVPRMDDIGGVGAQHGRNALDDRTRAAHE